MMKREGMILVFIILFATFILSSEVAIAQSTCSVSDGIELVASHGAASDFFGYSVAISGDVAIVGARLDGDKGVQSGSAYIFRRGGSNWIQEQKLFGSDQGAYDAFGTSVAIEGNTAVVRAPNHYINGQAGAVYIFNWNGTSWNEQQILEARYSVGSNGKISSIDISGSVIIIGAHQYSPSPALYKAGSTYVYRFNGTSWVLEQNLVAEDAAGGDNFGYSVSIDSDNILIGAYADDDLGNAAGSAYVFHFDGYNWVQEQKLLAIEGMANDLFGYSVAIFENKAIVGAYQDNSGGLGFGSAYVYRYHPERIEGERWVQESELWPSDGFINDYFGSSVAISNNLVAIGAYKDNDQGSQSGSVYVFRENGLEWNQEAKLLAPNGATNEYFGFSVGVSDDQVIGGAYWDDNINGPDAGSASIFKINCEACTNDADCSDNNFCNGNEICNTTLGCQDSADPCSAGLTCNEQTDSCTQCINQDTLNGYISQYYTGARDIGQLSNDIMDYLDGC
mgnify:CR=1 FL=1